MGAGASTLSEDRVKSIIGDEVDLSPYAISSDYTKTSDLKGYLSPLYVDESDKATLDIGNDNDSKWVTPKYVQTKFATGNVDASEVARNLATISDFQPVITNALRDNTTFQSGVARNLATVGTFQTAIWNNINGEVGSTFRSDLIARMASDSRFKGPRGDVGPPGTFNNAAIQANLWNGTGEGEGKKVMWCADGEICKVPVGKSGLEFTEGDQVIRGFGTGTNPKIVKVDDHLELKASGSINLARDRVTTGLGSLGDNDAKIFSKLEGTSNPTNDEVNASHLAIHGIGRQPLSGSRIPKKIKMYDDVEIVGDRFKFSDWTFHKAGTGELRIAPTKDGDGDWINGIAIKKNGNVGIGSFDPAEKLFVNGNVKLDKDAEIVGKLNVKGNTEVKSLRIGKHTLTSEGDNLVIRKDGNNSDANVLLHFPDVNGAAIGTWGGSGQGRKWFQ